LNVVVTFASIKDLTKTEMSIVFAKKKKYKTILNKFNDPKPILLTDVMRKCCTLAWGILMMVFGVYACAII